MTEMFEQIVEIKSLYAAWRKVRANKGSAGIDQVSWFGFEQGLDANLAELARNLRAGTYQPLPAKFVRIAKANGKVRELGILAIRDRVAQRAVLDQIEPLFEREMSDCNFAFRAGRNVEQAIRQVLLYRANGDWWTVESDIQNYFAEIDLNILRSEIRAEIRDEKVMRLIELWLEAGILQETDAETEKTWWHKTQENLTELNAVFGETVNQSLDEFLTAKLGLSAYEADFLADNPEMQDLLDAPAGEDVTARIRAEMKTAKSSVKREALKKMLESGLLFALSNRAMLARFVGLKFLGIGGAVLAAGLVAPKVYELASGYFSTRKGILQGSPLSPLLANIYLTAFDRNLTAKGLRLVRYCDDFVIACKTREEAETALRFAENELIKRRLSLHPEKTRIVAPNESFAFLGYGFAENGTVEPPPTTPEKYAAQIRRMAQNAVQISKRKISEAAFEKVAKLNSWESILSALNRRKD